MTGELDPKALATARKHGRLLRRRTIRSRVFGGVAVLFVSVAAILGYRDLAGQTLGQAPSTARSSSGAAVPVQSSVAYGDGYETDDGYSDDGEYGESEEGEDDEGGVIVTAPTSVPTPVVAPAPVVTQQS